MNNFTVELLFLLIVLVDFGATLTTKIYSKSGKEIQLKSFFVLNLSLIHIVFFDKLTIN